MNSRLLLAILAIAIILAPLAAQEQERNSSRCTAHSCRNSIPRGRSFPTRRRSTPLSTKVCSRTIPSRSNRCGPWRNPGALHRKKIYRFTIGRTRAGPTGRPSLQRISCAHVQDARPECRLRDVLRCHHGAKEYRMGTDRNPEHVASRPRSRTLEVTLLRPVAYFTASLPPVFLSCPPSMLAVKDGGSDPTRSADPTSRFP